MRLSPLIGLIQFPGSNCDQDCVDAFAQHYGIDLRLFWHTETSLPKLDGLILPGGFSYGDYLRSGHLASLSPVMQGVAAHAARGGAILGICNGFQILSEAGLLPGALLDNYEQNFICQWVELTSPAGQSTYQQTCHGKQLRIPVAHGQGRYYIDGEGYQALVDHGQIAYRYHGSNPNGSLDRIAGVCSRNGRILGLMPHPERATDLWLGGSKDGLTILEAFLASFL